METFGISKSASKVLKNRWELFYLSGRMKPAPLIGNYATKADALNAARKYATTRLYTRKYRVIPLLTNLDFV